MTNLEFINYLIGHGFKETTKYHFKLETIGKDVACYMEYKKYRRYSNETLTVYVLNPLAENPYTGEEGTAPQIEENPVIEIEVNGNLEFTGRISEIPSTLLAL